MLIHHVEFSLEFTNDETFVELTKNIKVLEILFFYAFGCHFTELGVQRGIHFLFYFEFWLIISFWFDGILEWRLFWYYLRSIAYFHGFEFIENTCHIGAKFWFNSFFDRLISVFSHFHLFFLFKLNSLLCLADQSLFDIIFPSVLLLSSLLMNYFWFILFRWQYVNWFIHQRLLILLKFDFINFFHKFSSSSGILFFVYYFSLLSFFSSKLELFWTDRII